MIGNRRFPGTGTDCWKIVNSLSEYPAAAESGDIRKTKR
jgi:hypothetical protein